MRNASDTRNLKCRPSAGVAIVNQAVVDHVPVKFVANRHAFDVVLVADDGTVTKDLHGESTAAIGVVACILSVCNTWNTKSQIKNGDCQRYVSYLQLQLRQIEAGA